MYEMNIRKEVPYSITRIHKIIKKESCYNGKNKRGRRKKKVIQCTLYIRIYATKLQIELRTMLYDITNYKTVSF